MGAKKLILVAVCCSSMLLTGCLGLGLIFEPTDYSKGAGSRPALVQSGQTARHLVVIRVPYKLTDQAYEATTGYYDNVMRSEETIFKSFIYGPAILTFFEENIPEADFALELEAVDYDANQDRYKYTEGSVKPVPSAIIDFAAIGALGNGENFNFSSRTFGRKLHALVSMSIPSRRSSSTRGLVFAGGYIPHHRDGVVKIDGVNAAPARLHPDSLKASLTNNAYDSLNLGYPEWLTNKRNSAQVEYAQLPQIMLYERRDTTQLRPWRQNTAILIPWPSSTIANSNLIMGDVEFATPVNELIVNLTIDGLNAVARELIYENYREVLGLAPDTDIDLVKQLYQAEMLFLTKQSAGLSAAIEETSIYTSYSTLRQKEAEFADSNSDNRTASKFTTLALALAGGASGNQALINSANQLASQSKIAAETAVAELDSSVGRAITAATNVTFVFGTKEQNIEASSLSELREKFIGLVGKR